MQGVQWRCSSLKNPNVCSYQLFFYNCRRFIFSRNIKSLNFFRATSLGAMCLKARTEDTTPLENKLRIVFFRHTKKNLHICKFCFFPPCHWWLNPGNRTRGHSLKGATGSHTLATGGHSLKGETELSQHLTVQPGDRMRSYPDQPFSRLHLNSLF